VQRSGGETQEDGPGDINLMLLLSYLLLRMELNINQGAILSLLG
jgi:hypothetical protein